MQEVPFFNEYGFKPSTPLKVPIVLWVILAFIVGAAVSYVFFRPQKNENVQDAVKPTTV